LKEPPAGYRGRTAAARRISCRRIVRRRRPTGASLAGDYGRGNIVVLRSFGKFYGLAGLRLGFALAAPSLVDRLDAMLGPRAVAGPALFIGERRWPTGLETANPHAPHGRGCAA
jgi:hypothetical protein